MPDPGDFDATLVGHDVLMPWLRKVIFGVGLLIAGAGVTLFVLFLTGQGVERASWWVTLVSSVGTVAGLVVAVWAWRHPVGADSPTNGGGAADAPAPGSGPVVVDGGVHAGGDVRVEARDQSVAAGVVQGSVSMGNPPGPGPV